MGILSNEGPDYKVGRVDGDLRRYHKNRPLANAFSMEGYDAYKSKIQSTCVQFEPDHGFVSVLMATEPLPKAVDQGHEVHQCRAPQTDPDPERAKRRQASAQNSPKTTTGRPVKQTGTRVRATGAVSILNDLHKESPLTSSGGKDRAIAALKDAGIAPKSAERKFSRWLKKQ